MQLLCQTCSVANCHTMSGTVQQHVAPQQSSSLVPIVPCAVSQGEFGPTVEPSFAPTQGQPTQAPTPTVDQPTQAPTPGQPTQAPTQEQLTQAPTPVQLTAVPTSASGNFNPKDGE